MMGTIIRIVVVGMDDAQAAPVVDAALAEMRRLESVLSEWIPESEISQVNAAAGQHPVKVGPDTLANVVRVEPRVGVERRRVRSRRGPRCTTCTRSSPAASACRRAPSSKHACR